MNTLDKTNCQTITAKSATRETFIMAVLTLVQTRQAGSKPASCRLVRNGVGTQNKLEVTLDQNAL